MYAHTRHVHAIHAHVVHVYVVLDHIMPGDVMHAHAMHCVLFFRINSNMPTVTTGSKPANSGITNELCEV